MEERKIGEIFEHNGEWYQCVEEEKSCINCAFRGTHSIDICVSEHKCLGHSSEDMPVIFKKLEKVGEPFTCNIHGDERLVWMQEYKLYDINFCKENALLMYVSDYKHKRIAIEIKQTKEDMEEKKLNLKPFDIQKAREGKPVCTRDGRKARIICFDFQSIENTPIVAAVQVTDKQEVIANYYEDGRRFVDGISELDLMVLPEKKEGWVNVYKGFDGVTLSQYPYTSKDEAIKESDILFGRIDTIKVSWEE